ncbi:hypothetical protein L593_12320 [Salinarchaeum sp. Harcht-Bsk1]|uniref:hypothetical protein n=1 Tax=Salinarchaeum sp. Harcht-Bsk1 TaxID=1333523 RepID=UPI0003422BEE|nr:hypothetical protein [Salinarchaeum sp. Harcht-Bsk1]AGN02403.1 hypothetical protein L593_12320 [Salinarchaeum sp. Harcht-Bsk1]
MLVPALAALVLAVSLTCVARRLDHEPGPPRSHVHETDDGERGRPFEALAEGAAADRGRCRDCGEVIESRVFRLCQSCASRPIPGD